MNDVKLELHPVDDKATDLAQEVSDLLARYESEGVAKHIVLSVAAAIVADYGRYWFSDEKLRDIAAVVMHRQTMPAPQTSFVIGQSKSPKIIIN